MSGEPRVLGRYRVERELGRGGMATVYLAHDPKHDRDVALKVLKPELSAALGAERFLQEIQVTARLSHPHILPLHDSGEAEGLLYYVMPYVAGESLRVLLERETQLPVDEALRITQQVAGALEFAHRQGVVHRDIKPENVLLHEGEAMVADFGIALAVSAAGGERLTETGVSMGTAEYMSPEQALGEGEPDARSDVYSLGCVLYEMLVGEPPYTGPTALAVVTKRLSDPVPSARRLRAAIPAAVDAALVRALAKERADRFGSAAQFVGALTAEAAEEVEAVKSIVVLPFENLSPDPDNAFFADGLTEELIAELSGVRALRVISRTTAMKLKDSGKDVAAISRDLDVQYVLEGSVHKAGNALRVTAQLIDAERDAHLWAERYSGTMDDVFDIQERLAREIVAQLKVKLSPAEDERITKPRISHHLAYECYLRARQLLIKPTEEASQGAIGLLEKALELEGPNELLYTAMGMAHARRFFGSQSEKVLQEEAERWAAKVFELNPDSTGGRVLQGLVLYHQGRAQEAVVQFKQVLRSDPDNGDALMHLVFIAGCSGHLDAARSYYQRLAAVDPMAEGMNPEWTSYYSGEFERAVEGFRAEYELDPESPYTRWGWGMCLAWAGRIEEGCEIMGPAGEDSPETPFGAFVPFCVAALQGDRDRALAAMTPELEAFAKRDIQFPWMVGSCYTMLGMVDEAIAWLRQAVDRGFINYPFLAEQEPFLASIRSEPRFQELKKEVKRRWEAFEP